MDGEEQIATNSATLGEVLLKVEKNSSNVVPVPPASLTIPPSSGPELNEVEPAPAVIMPVSTTIGSSAVAAASAPDADLQLSEGDVAEAESAGAQPGTSKEFEVISLEEKKQPRRIIHFSDGVLEEYSTDEEDGEENAMLKQPPVDPKTLDWLPYIWHYLVISSFAAYNACDYVGERLAYFFGITSPKYAYALSEYNRLEEEEKEALQQQIIEREEHREQVARETAAKMYTESS